MKKVIRLKSFAILLMMALFFFKNTSAQRVEQSCNEPFVYYAPPIYGYKPAGSNMAGTYTLSPLPIHLGADTIIAQFLWGKEDFVITTLASTATVKIYRADGTLMGTVIAPPGSPVSYPIPRYGADKNAMTTHITNTPIQSSGLRLVSDQPIQASYRLLSDSANTGLGAKLFVNWNEDILQLLGPDALGTKFVVFSHTQPDSNYVGKAGNGWTENDIGFEKHFASIMAIENGTTVTINVPSGIELEGDTAWYLNRDATHPDWNGSRIITLNAGESYIIATPNDRPNHYSISGTTVESDKPIVVTSGNHHSGHQSPSHNTLDAGLFQCLPYHAIGKRYAVVSGDGKWLPPSLLSSTDYFVVGAIKNATTYSVSVNGSAFVGGGTPITDSTGRTVATTLNAGEYATFSTGESDFNAFVIEASDSIYVVHQTSSRAMEFGLEMLPALDFCYGSKKVDFAKPNDTATAIIYVPTSALGSLRLTNSLGTFDTTGFAQVVRGKRANAIGSTGYSFVVIPNDKIVVANNRVTSSEKMHVGVTAFSSIGGGTGNYAFYSDYVQDVEVFDPITNTQTRAYVGGIATPNAPLTHNMNFGNACGSGNRIVEISSGPGGTVSLVAGTNNSFRFTLTDATPCASEVVTAYVQNGNDNIRTKVCITFYSSNSSINLDPLSDDPDDPIVVCYGAALNIDATSTGTGPVTYSWLSPDGNISTGPTVSVLAADASDGGRWRVTLTSGTCTKIMYYTVYSINCNDRDNDLVDNGIDEDDDNDGILDEREDAGSTATVDTDGDGIPNQYDLDSDNDGLPDVIEAGGVDTDGNGIIDGNNTGVNAQGIRNGIPLTGITNRDSDGDSYNNSIDIDSDNDGLPDIIEVGGSDGNADGKVDIFVDNGNGYNDAQDPSVLGVPLITTGTDADLDGLADSYSVDNNDADLVPNFIDLDSDNDGISEMVELGQSHLDTDKDGRIDDDKFIDVNLDGFHDDFDGSAIPQTNTDEDIQPNYLDLDSDNDGIVDAIEAGGTDSEKDGIIGTGTINDNDNGDGWSDDHDLTASLSNPDTDGDSKRNYLDIDSDNDGIVDLVEAGGTDANGNGRLDATVDADADGLIDIVDPVTSGTVGTPLAITNTDNASETTAKPDYIDIDSDNDGIVDNIEAQSTAGYQAPLNSDTDEDGLDNRYDADNGGTAITLSNIDADADADYIDTDTDNDTYEDAIEGWDTDNDGVSNRTVTSADSDNDGLLNAYDSDGTSATNNGGSTNNNTLPTAFPDLDNAGGDRDWRQQQDRDNDGVPDLTDLDDDNDGITDVVEGNADKDGDGILDKFDLDSDNDGIPDIIEAGGTDNNNDGKQDGVDANNNGIADNVEATPLTNPDTDGDGIKDVLDLDADNDGITDVTEAGGTDANGDGKIDGLTDNSPTNNRDGWHDPVSGAGNGLPKPDTDNDGKRDYLDLDSDADGITDITEAGGTDTDRNGKMGTNLSFNDTDLDGLHNDVDPDNLGTALALPDTDNDGNKNYLDIDSDDDGIVDLVEAQTTAAFVEPAGADADGDGIDNSYDVAAGTIVPVNTDGADQPDYLDTDSDNDTILDTVEAYDTNRDNIAETTASGNDTDGDGLDDNFDADGTSATNAAGSDNNDTPSSFPDDDNVGGDRDWRQALDTDGDGVPNTTDIDNDNDGILDVVEGTNDKDGDGIPNHLDLDSDNDGISDVIEANGSDPDGDGIIGSGDITDTDGDGYSNITDSNNGGTALARPDTDGDGVVDHLDLDSDNDGLSDLLESGFAYADTNNDGIVDGSDTDRDGIIDNADSNDNLFGGFNNSNPINTDSDTPANYRDLDSDNDGLSDLLESGSGLADANNDGIVDGPDADGDGIIDSADSNDSTFGGFVENTPTDTDGDNVPDYRDLDSDNDGLSDLLESGSGLADANNDGIVDGPDADGDGIKDAADSNDTTFGGFEENSPQDTDGDNVPDYRDLDSDNDGLSDLLESGSGLADANNDGVVDGPDADGDGIIDAADSNDSTFGGFVENNPQDTDGDNVPDFRDLDSDNDGLSDLLESGSGLADANNDGVVDGPDADGDGIIDAADSNDSTFGGFEENSPRDTDGDNVPDFRDLDSDNDGLSDLLESGSGLADANNDGVVDGPDADGDGIIDAADSNDSTFGGFVENTPQDTDGDSVPDHRDLDSDNDGISDLIESGFGYADANRDGIVDGPDADGDGIIDTADSNDTAFGGFNDNTPEDTDADGTPDYRELDSDNDGIFDLIESGNGFTDETGENGVPDGMVDGSDTDGDGILGTADSNPSQFGGFAGNNPVDTDGDGKPNYRDLDSDNDGINDGGEWDFNADGTVGDDCDGDNVPDYIDADACKLEIPQGFSPNGDGVNDTFVIPGLEYYPNNELLILNRWGNEVYRKKSYANDWTGLNNFGLNIGDENLPAGTYFYVLDLGNGVDPYKGSVTITK